MKQILGLICSVGLGVASVQAQVAYQAFDNTPYETPALTGFTTSGAGMTGMQVWAEFSDNTIRFAPWAPDPAAGVDAGKAIVDGWFQITEAGDTFNSPWTIKNLISPTAAGLSIVGFGLLGPSGDVVFDRTFGGAAGTTGSELGRDLELPADYSAAVTYFDIVNLTGFAPVGDLYAGVAVDLGANFVIAPGGTVAFKQDTDSASIKGSIIPRVPDMGSTALLVGLGLIGVGALRRRS